MPASLPAASHAIQVCLRCFAIVLLLLFSSLARNPLSELDPQIQSVCPNEAYTLRAQRDWAPNSPVPGNASLESAVDPHLWTDRRLLEIGGPSNRVIHALYDDIGMNSTNVIHRPSWDFFGQSKPPICTEEEADSDCFNGHTVEGLPFVSPSGRVIGTVLQRHGAVLTGVPDATYGVVLASHSLEHFVDPVAALLQWDRVLEPGGTLVLVLPWAPKSRDRNRAPATPQQLLHRYHEDIYAGLRTGDRAGVESYQAHIERVRDELTSGHRSFELAPNYWNKSLPISRQELCKVSCVPTDENKAHWFVYDFELLREMVAGCLGYDIIYMKLIEPYHQTMFAIKPGSSG